MSATRSKNMKLYAYFFLMCSVSSLFSTPKGLEVAVGKAQVVSPDANTMEIHVSDGAVLRWNDFSVEKGEKTTFFLSSDTAFVSNLVIAKNPSRIFGNINSNGQIFLFNPSGIVIGKSAHISAAGFIAGAFDVFEKDLMEAHEIGTKQCEGLIVNYGTIDATKCVLLLGAKAKNFGVISAGKGELHVASGSQFLIRPKENDKIYIQTPVPEGCVQNFGLLEAHKIVVEAKTNPYALAIRSYGHIDALHKEQVGGEIYLLAHEGQMDIEGTVSAHNCDGVGGDIHLLGKELFLNDSVTINASGLSGGGKISIGEEYSPSHEHSSSCEKIFFSSLASISANAENIGDGGNIVLWAEQQNRSIGNIYACGGIEQGNGGFVDISSRGDLQAVSHVDLRAPYGKTGMLIYDPCDIVVSSASDSPAFANPYPSLPFSGTAILNNSTLSTNLGSADVTLRTNGGTGGNGDITIENTVAWNAPHTLTLIADRDIIIKAQVNSAAADAHTAIDFTAGRNLEIESVATTQSYISSLGGDQLYSIGGDISLKPIGGAGLFTALDTNYGQIFISNASNITIGDASSSSFARIQVSDIGAPDLKINLSGSLHLLGGSVNGAYASILSEENILISGAENIILTGGLVAGGNQSASIESQEGDITISNVDHVLLNAHDYPAYILADQGNITFNTVSNIGLAGPSATDTYSTIKAYGNIGLSQIGSITLAAGTSSGAGSYVSLESVAGNIVADISDNLSVTSQNHPAFIQADSGYVTISNVQNIQLLGSDAADTYATIKAHNDLGLSQIGSIALAAGTSSGAGSYVSLESVAGNIAVDTADSINITAQNHPSYIQSHAGNVTVDHVDTVSLTGSSVADISSQIQAFANVSLNDIGSISITGGSFAGSGYARIYAGNNFSATEIDNLTLTSLAQDAFLIAGGSLHVNASTLAMTSSVSGQAYIEAPGDMSLSGEDLTLWGEPSKIAYIRNSSSNNLELSFQGNIIFQQYGLAQTSSGVMSAIAGKDLEIKNHSTIQTTSGGDITLVVDNLFPKIPEIGSGKFSLDSSSQVLSDGPVRIFSAFRENNSIENTINGYPFIPGEKYVNSSQEIWGQYYYSDFFGGEGFTIFYKDPAATEIYLASIASSELFYRLDWMEQTVLFSDFFQKVLQRYREFSISYDPKTYGGFLEYHAWKKYLEALTFYE
ncbi:MAG: filamentous hemagglutinin N-terminal domain-containing protein [Parachlamydiales bacterium]|nr:filamentous hemagglutinin N-terminal domain-containing protein [Parachlamydiales bacterium]